MRETQGSDNPLFNNSKQLSMGIVSAALQTIRGQIVECKSTLSSLYQVEAVLLSAHNAGLNFDVLAFADWAKSEAPEIAPSLRELSVAKFENGTLKLAGEKSAVILLELKHAALEQALERFIGTRLEVSLCSRQSMKDGSGKR